MARSARALRQLTHYLYAHEPVVEKGVLDRVFAHLQHERMIRIKIEAFDLDSDDIKMCPDEAGALKKATSGESANLAASEMPRFIWLPRPAEHLSPSRCTASLKAFAESSR